MPEHPHHDTLPELTLADRCEKCRAQAYVSVLLTAKSPAVLHFCGHHYAANADALAGACAIRDERSKLLASA